MTESYRSEMDRDVEVSLIDGGEDDSGRNEASWDESGLGDGADNEPDETDDCGSDGTDNSEAVDGADNVPDGSDNNGSNNPGSNDAGSGCTDNSEALIGADNEPGGTDDPGKMVDIEFGSRELG